jgi:acyl-CoA thioesterase
VSVESDPADLAVATRVSGSNGCYRATLSREWEGRGANAGYLAAVALRAAAEMSDLGAPASLSCHYLATAHCADVELMVNVLKRSRRSESLSVSMTQDGKPILDALIRTVEDEFGYEHQACEMPSVPAPELLRSYEDTDPGSPRLPFWRNVEGRCANEGVDSTLRAQDWMRFRPRACFDDPFVDAARYVILLESCNWPAVRRVHPGRTYSVTTMDLGVSFHRANAESQWLLIDRHCPIAGRGLMGVSGQVWDRDGRLLATGNAQLCCALLR